jgi:hypothetical protein
VVGIRNLSKFSESLNELHPLLAIKAWKNCAGPALLKKVAFLGVHKRAGEYLLKLGVSDSSWLQEMQYQKISICKKYNEALLELNGRKKDLQVKKCEIYLMPKKNNTLKTI